MDIDEEKEAVCEKEYQEMVEATKLEDTPFHKAIYHQAFCRGAIFGLTKSKQLHEKAYGNE